MARSAGEKGGTGMGLYIAKTSMEAMGGTVAVQSIPQGGAAFTLAFPAMAALRLSVVPRVSVTAPNRIGRDFIKNKKEAEQ